jgi:hypothetical protein
MDFTITIITGSICQALEEKLCHIVFNFVLENAVGKVKPEGLKLDGT